MPCPSCYSPRREVKGHLIESTCADKWHDEAGREQPAQQYTDEMRRKAKRERDEDSLYSQVEQPAQPPQEFPTNVISPSSFPTQQPGEQPEQGEPQIGLDEDWGAGDKARWMSLPPNPDYPDYHGLHREDDWCKKAGCRPACKEAIEEFKAEGDKATERETPQSSVPSRGRAEIGAPGAKNTAQIVSACAPVKSPPRQRWTEAKVDKFVAETPKAGAVEGISAEQFPIKADTMLAQYYNGRLINKPIDWQAWQRVADYANKLIGELREKLAREKQKQNEGYKVPALESALAGALAKVLDEAREAARAVVRDWAHVNTGKMNDLDDAILALKGKYSTPGES